MTAAQRRITLAVCLVVGLSLLMAAGLTFLVTPMAEQLGLADNVVEDVLAMPSVAALIMVFSAGQLGDRLGARRALVAASIAFSVGAVLIAVAGDEYPVQIGLAICAAAAVTAQIVGVSLIQQVTGGGRAQVVAFTTFGVVFPVAFLVFPVATARILEVVDWRLVPVIWAIAGLGMLAVTLTLVDAGPRSNRAGEWVTPLLAGIAFAGGARAVAEVDDVGPDPMVVAISIAVLVVAGGAFLVVRRRVERPSFTTAPVRGNGLPVLLVAVALVSLSGLLTYVSIAVEYLYDMTPYEASIAVIPAQLAAILGARVLARRALDRWGGLRAARLLMLVLAVAMLPLLALQAGSPLWFLTAVTTVFSFIWMGALTVLNAEVMRRAPQESTGAVSSFRTAASSLGGAIGMGVLGTIVISAVPVEAGADAVSLDELTGLMNGLRLDGLLACLVALAGWGLLRSVGGRRPARAGAVEPASGSAAEA